MVKAKRIYSKIIDILQKKPLYRKGLIDEYIRSLGLTRDEMLDKSTSGKANIARSLAGQAIDEMTRKGIIIRSQEGIYTAFEQKPIVIRNERCVKEILTLLSGGGMTKAQIKQRLYRIFETDKTLTDKDDSKLSAICSELLRKMVGEGVIILSDNFYSLPERIEAKIDDINGMLVLKEAFLSRIHKKGGEFFEVFFMTLLGKYLEKNGKTVISNTTTGGSADGGIDGIIETVDCLGFRETVMVQTKNRTDISNETDVRGFYGAVCARSGSRGIFATSSGFHYGAKAFLDGIDNCVGVDGEKLFQMAKDVSYGLKKHGTGYAIDERII